MSSPDPYLSPFAWRYGSPAMRTIWSEHTTRRLWRQIWVALARVQHQYGLVSKDQLDDLVAHAGQIDLERSLEVEAELHHDLMAEVAVFAAQCPTGGGIIHLGATSMDVKDNAKALQIRQALDLVRQRLTTLLLGLADQIEAWAATPCIGFTHLQPAEPTTIGYRLAAYGQDLLEDYEDLKRTRDAMRGKGFKGAVGTSASYAELLGGHAKTSAFEREVLAALELAAWPLANQTYPRRQDWVVLSTLAGLASTLHRFAMDLRVLQNPLLGEWSEPFGARQVGSSAMPFKRNPIRAEKINSLARYLAQLPRVAWDNAAHSLLERTLDDSANRRIILPEGFLAADELLLVTTQLVAGLQINEVAVGRTLDVHGPFAGIEPLLMRLVKAGASRQEMHEVLRTLALEAWSAVEQGAPNPLPVLVANDSRIRGYLSSGQIATALDVRSYVGDAPGRARRFAQQLRERLCE
ncbi:MAG: adenylosuccinate lyase [Anaerolineae bacterium]|nr:adenylosuccinate lyase [Anaerolineae bacterium]